jgi:hypothetical protein
MKKTARFSIVREKALGGLFDPNNLARLWRQIVRRQMRSLAIVDLYDYYDFSSSIDARAQEISKQVTEARYKATNRLIYRVEKQFGVCRHMMIPGPSDALVFHTITEYLAPLMQQAQPTNKAYYSRDKGTLKLPHEMSNTGYWFTLWPKYQKDILGFTDSCEYLVATDVTNFFDSIGLRELRHIVSSKMRVEEVVLDLLFNIIEQLSWQPDYLPTSLKGLPTINIEAFRLLPHIMLFEVDEVLNELSRGNFVRWMDDLSIGVVSKREAYTILGNVNEVLKSRGLALNLSKTDVYTADEAKVHFMFDENSYLDQAGKVRPTDANFADAKREFLGHFRHHLKNRDPRNWDRVAKRYFTIAGRLKIADLIDYSYALFLEYPEVRNSIIHYIRTLGYGGRTSRLVMRLLRGVERYDDVTLFELCKLITDLDVPFTPSGKDFISRVDMLLQLQPASSDFDLYCYIWFLAKYGEPHQIMTLIEQTRARWRNEQFLARQVVSVLPRCYRINQAWVKRMLDEQMTTGPRDAASVAINVDSLLNQDQVAAHDKHLFSYLFPARAQQPYPLPKYLILTAVLSSRALKPAPRRAVVDQVNKRIKDRWYLHGLRRNALLIV